MARPEERLQAAEVRNIYTVTLTFSNGVPDRVYPHVEEHVLTSWSEKDIWTKWTALESITIAREE